MPKQFHVIRQALAFKELEARGGVLEWDGDRLSLQLRKASTCIGSWRRPFEWITVRVGADSFQTVWLSPPQQPVQRMTPNIESIINDFEHREYKVEEGQLHCALDGMTSFQPDLFATPSPLASASYVCHQPWRRQRRQWNGEG